MVAIEVVEVFEILGGCPSAGDQADGVNIVALQQGVAGPNDDTSITRIKQ